MSGVQNGEVTFSIGHGSKHSRGVMTLVRPTVKVENTNITCDKNGRVLVVNLTIQEEEFCFATIYAPNDQNLQVDFYTHLTSMLRPYVNSNLVLGGDFNCPLENIDKKGGRDISSRENSIQSIVEMNNNLNLVDIWRLHHPSHERFTWQNSSGKIRCRLDYWLISKRLIPRTSNTDVKSYYDSDHSPIYAEIQYKNNQKSSGPGFWKFNNSLLDNEEFVTHLKFFLTHAKEKHRDIEDKTLYWEMIKMEIRDLENLEKRAHKRKHTVKLKTKENEYLEEPIKILFEMENFCKTLYPSQTSDDTFNASAPSFLNCDNIKRLDGDHQKACKGLITEEECLSALKQLSKNKTPGSDGLTAEFYLCFWEYVATPLKDCLNDAYHCGEMSISQRSGVISLLPKKTRFS